MSELDSHRTPDNGRVTLPGDFAKVLRIYGWKFGNLGPNHTDFRGVPACGRTNIRTFAKAYTSSAHTLLHHYNIKTGILKAYYALVLATLALTMCGDCLRRRRRLRPPIPVLVWVEAPKSGESKGCWHGFQLGSGI